MQDRKIHSLRHLDTTLCTRLAPTPSGWLHQGNGISFIVTWCLARAARGKVFLRIDDLDKDRRREAYLEDIFFTLDWLGLDFDAGPAGVEDFLNNYSQHTRLDRYQKVLDQLKKYELVYACSCTRSEIKRRSTNGLYPGTCRKRQLPFDLPGAAWRIEIPDEIVVGFTEWGQHDPVIIRLPEFMGDFVVRQKNGYPAYQIASVVDDLDYQVNFVVRGEDLRISTAAQVYLASLLGLEGFVGMLFWHHPLVLDSSGEKLSKSHGAEALSVRRKSGESPQAYWVAAADWLGLDPAIGRDPVSLVAACRERYFAA